MNLESSYDLKIRIRKLNKYRCCLKEYGKKILSAFRHMEFHEREEEMVAAANSHHAHTGWYSHSGWTKLFTVAFHICFVLLKARQALYIDVNLSCL